MTTFGHQTTTRFKTKRAATAAAAALASRANFTRAHVFKSGDREWTLDCVVKHVDGRDTQATLRADLAAVEAFGRTGCRYVRVSG